MKSDTCVALATNPSSAGLTVLRMSGPRAFYYADLLFRKGPLPVSSTFKRGENTDEAFSISNIINKKTKHISELKPYQARLGYLVDLARQQVLDQVIALKFVGPKSYTGEDVVEFSFHGGLTLAKRVLNSFLQLGVAMAEPGEFTKRAFLNGKIDLTQAEAVADLINSESAEASNLALEHLGGTFKQFLHQLKDPLISLSAKIELALQYPEHEDSLMSNEEIESRVKNTLVAVENLLNSYERTQLIKEGFYVALVGRPNAGKSSLLNGLFGSEKAIVTPIEGTTRDCIEGKIAIAGYPVILVDTAGLRNNPDEVEKIGILRTHEQIEKAHLVMWVQSIELVAEEAAEQCYLELLANEIITPEILGKIYFIFNKIDILSDFGKETENSSLAKWQADFFRHLANFVRQKRPDLEAPFASLGNHSIFMSATEKKGFADFERVVKEKIADLTKFDVSQALLANSRQKVILENIAKNLRQILTDIAFIPWDILAVSLMDCLKSFAELTGEVADELLLTEIFTKFCVGK